MTSPDMSPEKNPEEASYAIRIRGRLDRQRWAAHFEGMTIRVSDDGTTLIAGPVIDQAALYGLLRKVRDMGMPLISVVSLHQSDD